MLSRKHKPTVYLSGGVGNQLFQVAFAHYLNKLTGLKTLVVKQKLIAAVKHTEISFFSKHWKCNHCIFKIHTGAQTINRIFNPWDQTTFGKRSKFIDLRHSPFINPQEIEIDNSKNCYIGYFQNKEYVIFSEAELESEIRKVLLFKQTVNEKTLKFQNAEVIHIRQGDTNTEFNRKRVGILDSSYYQDLLGNTNSSRLRIVLTDDLEGARKILNGIKVDCIIGPEDLNPWESLQVMAQCQRLIAANSTFSWWGGFLASKKGAEVVIPKPFFVSPQLAMGDSLKYPGFDESPSSFIP